MTSDILTAISAKSAIFSTFWQSQPTQGCIEPIFRHQIPFWQGFTCHLTQARHFSRLFLDILSYVSDFRQPFWLNRPFLDKNTSVFRHLPHFYIFLETYRLSTTFIDHLTKTIHVFDISTTIYDLTFDLTWHFGSSVPPSPLLRSFVHHFSRPSDLPSSHIPAAPPDDMASRAGPLDDELFTKSQNSRMLHHGTWSFQPS